MNWRKWAFYSVKKFHMSFYGKFFKHIGLWNLCICLWCVFLSYLVLFSFSRASTFLNLCFSWKIRRFWWDSYDEPLPRLGDSALLLLGPQLEAAGVDLSVVLFTQFHEWFAGFPRGVLVMIEIWLLSQFGGPQGPSVHFWSLDFSMLLDVGSSGFMALS